MGKQATSLAAFERRKYQEIWAYSQYRHYSPGEHALPIFRQVWRKRGTLVDLGCGTGRAGAKLAEDGWDVTLLDFVDNSLDFKVKEKNLPFVRANLWTNWEGEYDYGYCCDCMEHIPEEKVVRVLRNIVKHCRRTFFSIHFLPDNFGKVIGHPLHLTVQPFVWWRDLLREHGELVDARDQIGIGAFFLQRTEH